MRQSNTYIIVFAAGLTIVLGGILSAAAVYLKPLQQREIALDTKKQILSAVIDTDEYEKSALGEMYNQRIKSIVVDSNGDEVTLDSTSKVKTPEDVNIKKEYKKDPSERLYPVFMYMSESGDKVEAYILPLYGFGLWDDIWGFAALEPDFNTLKGIVFDHKGETPGLGARITDAEVRNRYQGKELKDASGKLVSVTMVKGENNSNLNEHQVDGMSGATITGNGVNKMLGNYIGYYDAYFKNVKSSM